jgi:hypothetical protein
MVDWVSGAMYISTLEEPDTKALNLRFGRETISA